MAAIALAPDQPAESLRKPRPHDAIVMSSAPACRPTRGVEDGGTRPRHAFHDDEPQGMAGNIDAVPQRLKPPFILRHFENK